MQTRRLLLDTVLALAAALTLGAVGWFAASAMLHVIASHLRIDSLIATSPLDVYVYRAKLALAFCLAPILAWMTALVHRSRRAAVPGPAPLALYVGLPLGFTAVGMGLRFLWIRAGLASAPPGLEIRPTVESLSLAGWGAGGAMGAAIGLTVVVALIPRRQA